MTTSRKTTAEAAFDPRELIGRRVWLVDFRDPLIQRQILPGRFGFITGVGERGRVHVTYFFEPNLESREQRHTADAQHVLLLHSREEGCELRTKTRTPQTFCYPHIDPFPSEAFYTVKG